jgi:hypothetical protein
MVLQHIDITFHGIVCIAKLLKLWAAFPFFILFAQPYFFGKYYLLYSCFPKGCLVLFAVKTFVKTMAVNLLPAKFFPIRPHKLLTCAASLWFSITL